MALRCRLFAAVGRPVDQAVYALAARSPNATTAVTSVSTSRASSQALRWSVMSAFLQLTGAATLSVEAVEVDVEHDVALADADLREQTLEALTGLTDEDAATDRLVGGRVLPEYEHPGRTVEPAPVEDRPPLDPEVVKRVGLVVGMVRDEGREGLADVAGTTLVHDTHGRLHGRLHCQCRAIRG